MKFLYDVLAHCILHIVYCIAHQCFHRFLNNLYLLLSILYRLIHTQVLKGTQGTSAVPHCMGFVMIKTKLMKDYFFIDSKLYDSTAEFTEITSTIHITHLTYYNLGVLVYEFFSTNNFPNSLNTKFSSFLQNI